MKIINTKLHGILDYLFGTILLLPWITAFSQSSSDSLLLAGVGALVLFMSLLTDYELGLIKLIPMGVHLLLDICTALLLIATPFLFPVYNYMFYWPMVMGIAGLVIVLLSSREAYRTTRKDQNITLP